MLRILKSVVKSIGKAIYQDQEMQKLFERYPRFFYFVKKRFTPDEKFGLHLTLGIIFTFIFIFLFFGLLDSIIGQESLIQSDLRIINLIQIFRTPLLNYAALFITYLGSWQVVFFGVAILFIILALLKLRRYLVALLFSVFGGEFFIWVVKNIIERPRPPLVNALAPEKSFSFPSGHSFVALSFYGLVAYFLFRAVKNKFYKALIIFFTFILILLIGSSRIYLGVHWPTDVLASYASGAAWLSVLITSLETRRKFKNHEKRIPFLAKKNIIILGVFLVGLWGFFIVYFFQTNPLKPAKAIIEKQINLKIKDIPQELFATFPRVSEKLTGDPMEPINIIIVGSQKKLNQSFAKANWVATDPITVNVLWDYLLAVTFNRSYPAAPGTPSFWNTLPNDFSFAQPTQLNSVKERHHLHLWSTPFIVDNKDLVWFGTAHYDKEIRMKSSLIPIHAIDPAVDKERDKIKADLVNAGEVKSFEEFQIVEPTLGSNSAGDQFFTDGKAYIFFLKDE